LLSVFSGVYVDKDTVNKKPVSSFYLP